MHYYILIMKRYKRPIFDIIADVLAHYHRSGLTQSAYAAKAGVNQSTMCRLEQDSDRKRLSTSLKKLCNYAEIDIYKTQVKDIRTQKKMLDALESIWDGTEEHATALTNLLKALGRI